MDCLIAMRKPLRKPQLAPKFEMPKKSKKAAPKVKTVFAEAPPCVEEPAADTVCFVDLYRHARLALETRHVNTPVDTAAATPDTATVTADTLDTATDMADTLDTADTARSDTSLVTRYPGRVARAHLMYELEYDRPYDLQAF